MRAMMVDKIFAAAAKEKQRLMTPLCANFSYDFARVMAELGGPSVNEDLIRTYSYFLWKIDWFIDTFPMWKDNVHPSEREMPDVGMLSSFARYDVYKFGAVMCYIDSAERTYTELVYKVELHFGPKADDVLAEMDEILFKFIKYSDVIPDSKGAVLPINEFTLETYAEYRTWASGLVPVAGYFWHGKQLPKDDQVQQACMLCALINDLYDYTRDRGDDTNLSVCNYFDTTDDAIAFVRGVFDLVCAEVGPETRAWIAGFLRYQQDARLHSLGSVDRRWFDRLNSTFCMLKR